MNSKKIKISLLTIFSVLAVIIFIIIFSRNNNETLYLSKNVNKFKLITHSNKKFDEKFFLIILL